MDFNRHNSPNKENSKQHVLLRNSSPLSFNYSYLKTSATQNNFHYSWSTRLFSNQFPRSQPNSYSPRINLKTATHLH